MCRKLFFLICFGLVLSVAEPASAICFNTRTLASYEPDEVNDLNTPPDGPNLTATWERGGVNDVPEATEGDYVLKLSWTNEIDHKIAVGHYWKYTRFDLAGADFIHADVYVADESAMPGTMGIWDNSWQYKWIDADCEPIRTNEWRSIAFGVSALNEVGLDHIEALVFDALAGTSGTIYIDNLRIGAAGGECQCKRKIVFSGYTWSVLQSEWEMGAGPNYYTDDANDVWVDPNGHLHLNIVYKDANWYCSEVIANENFGYGTYAFTVKSDINQLDPNIILGLFIYDVPDPQGNPREIDVELTKWGDPNNPNNAQFVVQPWQHEGNVCRFNIDYSGDTETTTHVITWKPNRIDFCSYYGDYTPHPCGKDIIDCWSYLGDDIPKPGCENPRINFYLMKGDPSTNGQDAEIVIKNFQYLSAVSVEAAIDIDPDVFEVKVKKPKEPKKPKKEFLEAFIELPADVNVADVDVNTVTLSLNCTTLATAELPVIVDNVLDVLFPLDANNVGTILGLEVRKVKVHGGKIKVETTAAPSLPIDLIELTVSGELMGGGRFSGTDAVRVMLKKHHGD